MQCYEFPYRHLTESLYQFNVFSTYAFGNVRSAFQLQGLGWCRTFYFKETQSLYTSAVFSIPSFILQHLNCMRNVKLFVCKRYAKLFLFFCPWASLRELRQNISIFGFFSAILPPKILIRFWSNCFVSTLKIVVNSSEELNVKFFFPHIYIYIYMITVCQYRYKWLWIFSVPMLLSFNAVLHVELSQWKTINKELLFSKNSWQQTIAYWSEIPSCVKTASYLSICSDWALGYWHPKLASNML